MADYGVQPVVFLAFTPSLENSNSTYYLFEIHDKTMQGYNEKMVLHA